MNFEMYIEFVFPVAGTFCLRIHYCNGTSICIQYCFVYEQVKRPFEKKLASFVEEKMILADSDPKQLLTADFVCFSYLREIPVFPIQGNFKYTEHFSGPNRLDV